MLNRYYQENAIMALDIIQRAKSLGSNLQNLLENPKRVFVNNRILWNRSKRWETEPRFILRVLCSPQFKAWEAAVDYRPRKLIHVERILAKLTVRQNRAHLRPVLITFCDTSYGEIPLASISWRKLYLVLVLVLVLQAFLDTGLPRGNRHERDS